MAIVIAIAAGVAAFVAMRRLAYGLQLRNTEAFLGAAFTGVLVSLAVGDLLIKDLRGWWTERPMLAAAIAGSLLLGLTVLLVDRAVERSRSRQWRRVLAQPVSYLLDSVLLGEINEARFAIQSVPWQTPGNSWPSSFDTQAALDRLRFAATRISATVNQVRPELLLGGEDTAGTYKAALNTSAAAERATDCVAEFREKVTAEDGSLFLLEPLNGELAKRAAYVRWLWAEVRTAYDTLATALDDLQEAAHTDFQSELPRDQTQLPIVVLTLDEAETRGSEEIEEAHAE